MYPGVEAPEVLSLVSALMIVMEEVRTVFVDLNLHVSVPYSTQCPGNCMSAPGTVHGWPSSLQFVQSWPLMSRSQRTFLFRHSRQARPARRRIIRLFASDFRAHCCAAGAVLGSDNASCSDSEQSRLVRKSSKSSSAMSSRGKYRAKHESRG